MLRKNNYTSSVKLFSAHSVVMVFLSLLIFNDYARSNENAEQTNAPFTIPVNGYNNAQETSSRIESPAIYATRLSTSLECHQQNCEEKIIKALTDYYSSELNDFYSMFVLNDSNDLRLNEEALMKLKSMRLLEQFLRHSDYEKAANRLNDMFEHNTKNVCVDVKTDDSGSPSQCDDTTDKSCKHSCLNKSLMQLLKEVDDPDDKKALLDAFSADNPELQSSIDQSCGIHQQDLEPDSQAQNLDQARSGSNTHSNKDLADKKWEEQNKKLCGILTSEFILSGFARGVQFYASNTENDSPSNYQCLGARLAIDTSQNPWRPDPNRPKLLYVIYQDKTVYRLNEEDLSALQTAVEQYRLAQKKGESLAQPKSPIQKLKHSRQSSKKTILHHSSLQSHSAR